MFFIYFPKRHVKSDAHKKALFNKKNSYDDTPYDGKVGHDLTYILASELHYSYPSDKFRINRLLCMNIYNLGYNSMMCGVLDE